MWELRALGNRDFEEEGIGSSSQERRFLFFIYVDDASRPEISSHASKMNREIAHDDQCGGVLRGLFGC